MKSKAFAAQIRHTEFGHGAPSLGGLADTDVADIGEFPGLHVQVAVGQTGSRLHLGKGNRQAGNQRGQDAEATGGANHFVELKLHELVYFVSRSIRPERTSVKRDRRNRLPGTSYYEVIWPLVCDTPAITSQLIIHGG